MGNGEFRPPGVPKRLNRLRWNLAWVITSVTQPHMHETKSVRKEGSFGGGVKCSSQACFFCFCLFVCFLLFPERTSSLPGTDWLGALYTQKRVFLVSWFLGGEIPPKSNVPILWGKTPFSMLKNWPRLTNGFNMGWIG